MSLRAIMFSDIIGYSKLMHDDEQLALQFVSEQTRIFHEVVGKHDGDIKKGTGDGFLVEFESAKKAIACAIEVQLITRDLNLTRESNKSYSLRIGMHLGEVHSREGDVFGDAVNIASRIESFAPKYGIAVSREFANVIESSSSFRSLGSKSLKNITRKIEVFSVNMPWESESSTKTIADKIKSYFSRANGTTFPLALLVLASLVLIFHSHSAVTKHLTDFTPRLGASDPSEEVLFLDAGWEVAKRVEQDANEGLQWHAYDPSNPELTKIPLDGQFLLRKKFSISKPFKLPTLIIGLVRGKHRVFINEYFIGGGQTLKPVRLYGFDSKILSLDRPNELVVKVEAPKSYMPGFVVRKNARTSISEFSVAEQALVRNRAAFYDLRSVYFLPAFLIGFFCLILHFFRGAPKFFFNLSAYVFVSSVLLLYYNPVVTNALPVIVMRFLKVFSYCLAPLALTSIYCNVRGAQKTERVVNWSAIAFLCIIAAGHFADPQQLSSAKNWDRYMFIVAALFAFASFVLQCFDYSVQYLKAKSRRAFIRAFENKVTPIIVTFSLFAFMTLLVAADYKIGGVIPAYAKQFIAHFGIAAPFAFSILVAIILMFNSVQSARKTRIQASRERFLVAVSDELKRPGEPKEKIQYIQNYLCRHLGAERSTFYLFENYPEVLKSQVVIGDERAQQQVANVVRPDTGIFKHVISSKSAALIRDVDRDTRFGVPNYSQGANTYRSKSCMVFPLILRNVVIGVMTIADKSSGESFNDEDFTLTHLLINDLSTLATTLKQTQYLTKTPA